jgi:hypothetical protein
LKTSKVTAILASVLLLGTISVLPASAGEQSGEVACSEGGSFIWISFNGANFTLMSGDSCKGTAVIPEGVTHINAGLFRGSGLKNIVLPTTVTKIDADVFANTPMTQFTVPDQLTSIDAGAFAGSDLQTLNISAGASGITATSIRGAKKLVEVNVNQGNNSLSSESGVLFDKAKTTLILYPAGKSDTSYVIPNTVTHIGAYAFENQAKLVSVTIPTSVVDIGESAFRSASSLKNYSVPAGATVGKDAFRGAGGVLKDQIIKCSKGGSIQTKGDMVFVLRPAKWWGNRAATKAEAAQWEAKNCQGNVVIPSGIAEIPTGGFSGTRLSTLTIPKTVKVIGEEAFASSRLTSITLPEGLTTLSWGLFSQATKLKTVKLPSTLTSIGDGAFTYAESLTEITIPKSVQSIGIDAFSGATSLKKIVIPVGVKAISDNSFNGALSLSEVTIPSTVEIIGVRAFTNTAFKAVTLPEGVKEISDRSFNCLITSPVIVLPASLTKMSNRSFDASLKNCRPAKRVGTPKVYFLGNAPAITGNAADPITIYISKKATGFDLDPTTKLWHGFKVAYGSPPKATK